MFAEEPTAPEPGATLEAAPSTAKTGGVNAVVRDQNFILWSVALAGVLLVAAAVITILDRWRKRTAGESPRDTSLTMSSFRELYENGEITEAEYDRIRAKMAAKLKEKAGVSPPPPPPPPAQLPPPESTE